MLDALASIALPPAPRPARADDAVAPAFSYAMASAALEGRAGTALKVFGATAEGGAAAQSGAARAGAPERSAVEQGSRGVEPGARTETSTNPAAERATPIGEPAEHRAQPTPIAPAVATSAPAAAPFVAAPISTAPVALRAGVETITARETLARAAEARAPQKFAAAAPKAPAEPVQAFARFAAARLEGGASTFEMRLDPPELGRIEARLTLSEDGHANLALAFDNQAALDQFRRDEAALRLLFSSSGFSFAEGDVAFSLRERNEGSALSAADGARGPAIAAGSDFTAAAAGSAGLVDLLI